VEAELLRILRVDGLEAALAEAERLLSVLGTSGGKFAEISHELEEALERIEPARQREIQSMENWLAVETLRLQGLDAEADALRLAIKHQEILAPAMDLGNDALVAQYQRVVRAGPGRAGHRGRHHGHGKRPEPPRRAPALAPGVPAGLFDAVNFATPDFEHRHTAPPPNTRTGGTGGTDESIQFHGPVTIHASTEEGGAAALRGMVKEAERIKRAGGGNAFQTLRV
jgi:hypothetical protein